MEVDTSSRFRQSTQYQQNNATQRQTQWPVQQQNTQYNNQGQANKRPNNSSARFTGPKQQRVNHVETDDNIPEQYDQEYQTDADAEVNDINDDLTDYDQINFLGTAPCSRSLKEQ